MSKGFASNPRMVLVAAAIFAGFAGVGVRLVFLHVLERDERLQYVEKARRSFVIDKARRGDIVDVNGNILATSRTLLDVGVDPQALRARDRAQWSELARLLQITEADLQAAAALQVKIDKSAAVDVRPVQWVKLAEGIDEPTYEQVRALKVVGIYGVRTYRRTYPQNALAAHVLGYVNKEEQPAAGVEQYMDFFLRGQDGWRESERDGRRQELAQFRTREVPPVDGYHVVLSLDIVIQHMIEEELQQIVRKYTPEKATIIVSDAHTGFIRGLGNHPSFNLNEYGRAPLAVMKNYAVTDVLEPGSTFKIVAASAALNEGLVTPGSEFDCGATEVEYRGRHLRLPRDDHPFQDLSVAEIVSHSSNRGAARLGMLLGEERFYRYACAFGFGSETGFPFGGEVPGLFAPPTRWNALDITRLPMGHAVAATPLQMHCAMATIANGGVLLRPQIISQVRTADGVLFDYTSTPRRQVISERTARTMARLLMGVASSEGTAPEAAIRGYEVAGKTGTTQKLIDGQYSTQHHVGSFVGFFPASRPRVVLTVIIDDAHVPGGLAYGRVVAVPSFRHLAEQLIQYLDIKPVVEIDRARFAYQGGPR